MIQQFTYTASPWGKTGAGWMVFQQSRNVPPDAARALYPVYRYEGDPNSPDAARTSVQFAYLPADSDDGAVLAQTTFTGTRWFDPRPGDFFAHVLLLDKDAVLRSATSGINPVRLFLSPGLQTAFPDALKEKALQIYRKDIAWEPPPELPELSSLAELPTNPILSFEAIVRSLPDKVVPKLGAILRSALLRTIGKGDAPVVFDAKNADSAAIMVLVLDLLPPTWRARTWCAVRFRESALRRLPAFSSLSFYGTDTDKPSDFDTGVVSGVDNSQDPFVFRSKSDLISFKRQLDCLGEDVSLEAYRDLTVCWEVAASRKTDVGKLREAANFANQFPAIRQEMVAGLRILFADDELQPTEFAEEMLLPYAVASFELGLFKSPSQSIPGAFMENGGLFGDTLRTLNGTGRGKFLDVVFGAAKEKSTLAALAKMWRTCDNAVRDSAKKALNPDGGFAKFVACADRMDNIRHMVRGGLVPEEQARSYLVEIAAAEKEFGLVFGDMGEEMDELRYLVASADLPSVKELHDRDLLHFAETIKGLRIRNKAERVKSDILKRVPPGEIPVDRLLSIMPMLETLGIDKTTSLHLAIEAAEKRGEKNGSAKERAASDMNLKAEREKRDRGREMRQGELDSAKDRWGTRPIMVVLIALIAAAIGFFGGLLVGGFLLASVEPPEDAAMPPAAHVTRKVGIEVRRELHPEANGASLTSVAESSASVGKNVNDDAE